MDHISVERREHIITLCATIAELRSAIKEKQFELNDAERALNLALDSTEVKNGSSRDSSGGSIRARVLVELQNAPDEVFNAEELAERMGDVNLPSLRSALGGLANEKAIDRARRGYYRAKSS